MDRGATGIVCINLSSHLSGTMQSAQVAAAAVAGECPVQVIDSQSASMGQGNLCLTVARRAADGDSLESIVTEVVNRRDRTKLYATLDTLDSHPQGGRIGNARALLGSMLSIKPIIEIKEGVVEEVGEGAHPVEGAQGARGEGRGAQDRAPRGAARQRTRPRGAARPPRPVFPRDEIITGVVGPVIGTHAGPRVIGVSFQVVPLTALPVGDQPGCSVAATTSWSRSRAAAWRRCGSPTTPCCRAGSR